MLKCECGLIVWFSKIFHAILWRASQKAAEAGLTVGTEPRSSGTGALEAGGAGFCSDVWENKKHTHVHTLWEHMWSENWWFTRTLDISYNRRIRCFKLDKQNLLKYREETWKLFKPGNLRLMQEMILVNKWNNTSRADGKNLVLVGKIMMFILFIRFFNTSYSITLTQNTTSSLCVMTVVDHTNLLYN